MALAKESVKLGISILKKINLGATVVRTEIYDKDFAYVETDKIYCVDEKYDDGYENVFTNIENITPMQLELWEMLKEDVPNSSFNQPLKDKDYPYNYKGEKKDNVTCIGWF